MQGFTRPNDPNTHPPSEPSMTMNWSKVIAELRAHEDAFVKESDSLAPDARRREVYAVAIAITGMLANALEKGLAK